MNEASFFSKFMRGLYLVGQFFKNYLGKPLYHIGRFILFIFLWYKGIWKKQTYSEGAFSVKRGLFMILGTVFTVILTLIALNLMVQTSYYLLTVKTEKIYLANSEEVYPDEDMWGVKGCYTTECTSKDSLYFRINRSKFHHLLNLIKNRQFFIPDVVAASVPVGQTQCVVKSYGIRSALFNIYPKILEIDCRDDQN